MLTTGDNVELSHPDYEACQDLLEFLRISFEGQTAFLEAAFHKRYIRPPAGMIGYPPERTPLYHKVQANVEAYEYIERTRYPEVLSYAVAMAVGKAWSRAPEIKGEGVKAILDTLWGDGSDFRTGVLKALTDYLLTGGGGFHVNLNEDGQAVIHHYAPESVVNWSKSQTALRLVMFEAESEGDNPFDHELVTCRYVAGLDDETGEYFLEKWNKENVTDKKGKPDGHAWLQDGERVYPTSQRSRLKSIPYFVIGDWKLNPIFKAMAETAKTYARAYAEYAHAMYWSAMPQPVIKFSEGGGFWGVDEYSADAVSDDAETSDDPEIKFGCTTPILLRDGDLSFVSAPTGSLSALKERVKDLREEIGSLGARAFNNTTNANNTAETERLQNAGEGSLIHSAFREVAAAIIQSVRMAAKWRGIPDADDFSFEFDSSILFDDFALTDINYLQALHADGYITRRHVRNRLRRQDIIGPDETDAKIDKELAEEGPTGGGFGDDTFDPGANDDVDLGADLDDDEDGATEA